MSPNAECANCFAYIPAETVHCPECGAEVTTPPGPSTEIQDTLAATVTREQTPSAPPTDNRIIGRVSENLSGQLTCRDGEPDKRSPARSTPPLLRVIGFNVRIPAPSSNSFILRFDTGFAGRVPLRNVEVRLWCDAFETTQSLNVGLGGAIEGVIQFSPKMGGNFRLTATVECIAEDGNRTRYEGESQILVREKTMPGDVFDSRLDGPTVEIKARNSLIRQRDTLGGIKRLKIDADDATLIDLSGLCRAVERGDLLDWDIRLRELGTRPARPAEILRIVSLDAANPWTVWLLAKKTVSLGRQACGADVGIAGDTEAHTAIISRRHALLVWTPDGLSFQDTSSRGCWLDGKRYERNEFHPLPPETRIDFGHDGWAPVLFSRLNADSWRATQDNPAATVRRFYLLRPGAAHIDSNELLGGNQDSTFRLIHEDGGFHLAPTSKEAVVISGTTATHGQRAGLEQEDLIRSQVGIFQSTAVG